MMVIDISGKIMLGLLYLVIGFGMFGTFLMMTRERMYEFGLMMAVGMKKYRMQIMVFMEFLFLCFLGVLSGVVLSLPLLVYFYFNPIYISNDGQDIFEKFGMEPVYAFSLDPSIFYSQAWIVFIMTILLVIVGGIYAFLNLPKLEDPFITIREAVVIAKYPGMPVEQVEQPPDTFLET